MTNPLFDESVLEGLREAFKPADLQRILLQTETEMMAIAGQLHEACRQPDLPRARQIAHKLVGLAANTGCVAVATTSRAIETACKGGELPAASLAELEKLVPATIAGLKRLHS